MKQAIQPVAATLNENYKKQLAINEYQLILPPHEELRSRVLQLRAAFEETYQVPALAGRPHVTLVRFTQLALMEERILQRLRTIAMGFCPFKVELKDFGSLPTHSIFINVTSKLPIRGLVTEIRDIQRLMKLDKDNKPFFPDEPNLLIARKLLPWQYEKGWLEYSNKSFTGKFIADGMLLLKRRQGDVTNYGKAATNYGQVAANYRGAAAGWQIAERFAFQNLPVSTRQGELFG
jgi:2'-5' RNA ligase